MSAASAWEDACRAAALLAVDPQGLGGASLRGCPGPACEAWLARLRELLPAAAPLRRLPLHAGDDRLLGGLDLAVTLHAGRPVLARGLLAEADGGVVVLPMAERASPGLAARLAAVLDRGEVVLERDGLGLALPARLACVALDEGLADEAPPPALLDRLAFLIELEGVGARAVLAVPGPGAAAVAAARALLPAVREAAADIERLGTAALALGVDSLRAGLLALRAARAAAALAGRVAVAEEDLAQAVRLVLAPRATRAPAPAAEAADTTEQPPPPQQEPDGDDAQAPPAADALPPEDLVLAAAQALLPPDLLARLRPGGVPRQAAAMAGRAAAERTSRTRGRPAGARPGRLGGGARLDLVETLRAAAPWQTLRRQAGGRPHARIEVRSADFRIARLKQRTRTTTIFVVDASGSLALRRLAEAKGAVELLLADCYIRRDRVALLAFRDRAAELLLPPTRALARAKRCLAGLPGGGGTPLASGLDAALALAEAVRRQGEIPVVVVLTDGSANIARDGTAGRSRAETDALAAAAALRAAALAALLVDTSPRPAARARQLAEALGGTYLPLPYADATTLSGIVQQAARAAAPAPAR